MSTAEERVLNRQRKIQNRAIASLLDVVEELAGGLAAGQRPDEEWADVVRSSFALHRRELATGDIEEDE